MSQAVFLFLPKHEFTQELSTCYLICWIKVFCSIKKCVFFIKQHNLWSSVLSLTWDPLAGGVRSSRWSWDFRIDQGCQLPEAPTRHAAAASTVCSDCAIPMIVFLGLTFLLNGTATCPFSECSIYVYGGRSLALPFLLIYQLYHPAN